MKWAVWIPMDKGCRLSDVGDYPPFREDHNGFEAEHKDYRRIVIDTAAPVQEMTDAEKLYRLVEAGWVIEQMDVGWVIQIEEYGTHAHPALSSAIAEAWEIHTREKK